MRILAKLDEPDVLKNKSVEWTAAYLNALAEDKKPRYYWQHEQIKSQLVAETASRCAYCDSAMLAVSYGEIEHILPRQSRPELVVHWGNLTLACSRCNGSKKAYYNEDLPLLNPYSDDPSEHLTYLGDLVFVRNASERGYLTLLQLKLDRADLNAARKRRLDYLNALLTSWRRASEHLRPGLEELIREDVFGGEYLRSALSLLEATQFPFAPGSDEVVTSEA